MSENALDLRKLEAVSPLVWIDRNQILLDGRPVDFMAHCYQIDPLIETNPRQCAMQAYLKDTVDGPYYWRQQGCFCCSQGIACGL